MPTPIPYLIKKGDSLSKIAGKLGIDDWQKLRTYHNNNCQPISEQIAEQLKEGKTLLTPSQEEIDIMNGKSQKIVEQKKEEEKEIEVHAEEKKQEKQIEAAKGEHDKKYFVVHGAECSCNQSKIPKKVAKLQVTTHSKVVFNDDDGKYAATEEDVIFDPAASTFGNCKLKPSGSSFLRCVIAPAPKWDKPYDKTKIMGKKVLTEISELKCLTGGKITVEKHGQTDSVLKQHAENTNALELAMVNPALKNSPRKSDIPNVTYIVAKKIENDSDFKEIRSHKEAVEKIISRPHAEISFEAKLESGNEKLVSWLVYEGHEGKKEQRLFMREQIGKEFKNSFESGNYRIEGYGSPKKDKNDKNYPSISLDLEIAHNRLDGSALLPSSGDFTIGNVGKQKLRKGFPATFDPKFLMPPTVEESERLSMYVTDEAGNLVPSFAVVMDQIIFTPKNSGAKYRFVAEYTDTEGNLSVQTFEAETIPNSVLGVKHETEIIRPFTNMNFSITKTKFSVSIKSDADLSIPELKDIKWSFNGKILGQGRTFTLPGTMLSSVGEYTVKAQALSSLGFGKSSKEKFDEWHFKVSENDVVSCSLNATAKTGKLLLITPKYIFKDKLPSEKVNWHIEGSGEHKTADILKYKSMAAGKKIISCKINSQTGIRIIVDAKQAIINDVLFTDSNGLKIEKASWGQKINVWIDQKELIGEKLEIVVWDDDTGSPDDPVKTFSIPNYDGKLIPFSLDKNVRGKTGKVGAFYVKVKAPELTAINEGKEFPKASLQVSDVREIYNAQLGSENGKEKHTVVDYDEISWFYAHTRGIKTDEKLYLEIHNFADPKKPVLLFGENAKTDESGAIKVKINWRQIKNKVNFLTVYAVVKENNADGKILYDADGSFSMATAKLMKSSSLVKEAGYKSAVMVEGSTIPITNNGTCVCNEQYKDLIWGEKVSCTFRKKVVQIAKKLKLPQQNYEGANWLMAVMALETTYTFSPKIGTFKNDPNDNRKGGYVGLIQFGKGAAIDLKIKRSELLKMSAEDQLDWVEKYFNLPQFKDKNLFINKTALYLAVNYPDSCKHASNKDYVVYDSSDAAYDDNDLFKREKHEYKIVKGKKVYPDDIVGSSYVWEFEKAINDVAKMGEKHKVKTFTCGIGNIETPLNAKDIITYHIYENGTIEKHIPRKIREECKQKYKYVYHDKEKNEHEVCIVDWFMVDKRKNGTKISNIPKSYVSTYNYPSGGNAQIAYVYSNGDICVSGTKYGYRKYSKGEGQVPLVKMKDNLSYGKDGINIFYSFQNSQRRYCNPDAYAGLIGALAKLNRKDVLCTGMCFADATSYPSVTHPNGDCADTAYYPTLSLEQKKVNVFKDFHFEKIYRGKGSWYASLAGTTYSSGHEDHLHSGEFDLNVVQIIKEK